MQNGLTELFSVFIPIVSTIATLALTIILRYYHKKSNLQLEAIQATLKPSIDVNIETSLELHRGYRMLLLSVMIKNVGHVIAVPVDLTINFARFDQLTYPRSTVLFNGKSRLTISFHQKISYSSKKFHPKIKSPERLKDVDIIFGYDQTGKKVRRYDGQIVNCCKNYELDDVVNYDYHVNEERHFNFPIIISGDGAYTVSVSGGFVRHKWVKGDRKFDVTDKDLWPVWDSLREVDPSIDVAERRFGDEARYGFGEDFLGLIPKPVGINSDYESGVSYFSQGNYERAFQLFDNVLKKNAGFNEDVADFYYKHTQTQYDAGETTSALESVNLAIKLDSNHAEAYNLRALLYRRQGLDEKALQDYDKALQLDPNIGIFHYNRARVLEDMKRSEEALSSYKRSIQLDPEYAPAYLHRGNLLKEIDRKEEALEDFNQAIKIDPKYSTAYNNRALLLDQLGKAKEALAGYNRAIKLNPSDAIMRLNRALLFEQLGKDDEALIDYDEAVELDPQNSLYYNNRGLVLERLERVWDAMADYNRAIELDPNDPITYRNRGLLLEKVGRSFEGLLNFNKALELDPLYVAAHLSKAWNRFEDFSYEEALDSFNRAIELEPKNAHAFNGRGRSFKELARYDDAVSDYKKAIEYDASFSDPWNNLGVLYSIIGSIEKALDAYSKAVEMSPDNAVYRHNRGSFFVTNGYRDDALKDYECLKSLDSGKADDLKQQIDQM